MRAWIAFGHDKNRADKTKSNSMMQEMVEDLQYSKRLNGKRFLGEAYVQRT